VIRIIERLSILGEILQKSFRLQETLRPIILITFLLFSNPLKGRTLKSTGEKVDWTLNPNMFEELQKIYRYMESFQEVLSCFASDAIVHDERLLGT